MKTVLLNIGNIHISNPEYGDLTLNLFPVPIDRNFDLPKQFNEFTDTIDDILKLIPFDENSSNQHYITIDSKFFTKPESLRREGLHVDGNFCGDPNFTGLTWGGTQTVPTWGGCCIIGHDVITNWVSPYGVKPPIGKYISEDLGGIFVASTEVGCKVFTGDTDIRVGSEGDVEHARKVIESSMKESILEANKLYFMTSNTPHETLLIDKGKRRTLIRVTLAHDYNNKLILNAA